MATFTPRLLLIDYKNALSYLPSSGGLYNEKTPFANLLTSEDVKFNEQDTLWERNRLEVLREYPIEKPEYQQDLDNPNEAVDEKEYDFKHSTRTWTDYMSTRYHPRSINLLPIMNTPDQETSFDCYSRGSAIWSEKYFDEDFGDRIRLYIEECNNCQGFQTLFDCSDAYSGLSLKILEHLQDEYGKCSFTVPIFSPKQINCGASGTEAMCDSIRIVNTALSYANLIECSSMILPLSTMEHCWRKLSNPRKFSGFNYDSSNLYETSAILATYLDTISLRYRVSDAIGSCHLASFCNDLTNYGRTLVGAAVSMPFKMLTDQYLIDGLDQTDGKFLTQLSPNSKIGTDRIVQSVCVRGISENQIKNTKTQSIIDRQRKMAAYRCNSVSEMFQLYFQCSNYSSLSHVAALQKGMPTKKPFPVDFFDNRFNAHGFLNEFELTDEQKKLNKTQSIPVLAAAQCSNDLADTIESLHREANRIKIQKIHRFRETGLEADEYTECLEKLLDFKDNYEDSFEL